MGYLMRQRSSVMPDIATPERESGIRGGEEVVEEAEVLGGEGRGCAQGAGDRRGGERDGRWSADVFAVEGEAATGSAGGEVFGALDAALFAGEAAAAGFGVAFARDGAATGGVFGGFGFFHGPVWLVEEWNGEREKTRGKCRCHCEAANGGPRQPGPARGLCQGLTHDEHPSLLLHPLDKLVPAANNGTNPSQCPDYNTCNLPS